MRSRSWLTGYFCIVIVLLCTIGAVVYDIDPYFHYHYPHTERYFYILENQRGQNDGITKHFDYNAIITGTSMTENFKTSEADALFGVESIKVPFSGASYKEVNDNLRVALRYHPKLRLVIRGLDIGYFFYDCDAMAYESEKYPIYLYNENPFDDVNYLFNTDVLLTIAYSVFAHLQGKAPGITSFDDYSAWQESSIFGIDTACPDGIHQDRSAKMEVHLTDEEKLVIRENIRANVTSLAEEYPDVTFYYFFTPYSAAWWANQVESGGVYRQIEAEQYVIELILECDNIRLYSFNNRTDIITDLNHYRDLGHYASWINSLMLRWMYDGEYLLTKENYMDYLEEERAFYTEFDYESLNGQDDYECDKYAAALLNEELCGVEPLDLAALSVGGVDKDAPMDGLCVSIQDVDDYKYLVFYGRNMGDGQISVQVCDAQGEIVAELAEEDVCNVDQEWHQYLLDISNVRGDVTICFGGRIAYGEYVPHGEMPLDAVLRDIYLY